MNGNGKLTETENVFLRKLRNSYGIPIRMNVIFTYFWIRARIYGYGWTETLRWKPGVTRYDVSVSDDRARNTLCEWTEEFSETH